MRITNRNHKFCALILATLSASTLLLQGCGGGASVTAVAPPPSPQAAPPAISSLAPPDATVGASALSVRVLGSGFGATSTVHWNGTNLPATFVSSTELTVVVPTTALSAAGTAQVQVFNAASSSNSVTFTIKNDLPAVQAITPSSAVAGAAGFTITVTGTGFAPASTVRWNGVTCATTFVSSTSLTAAVPASWVAVAGSAAVDVTSPSPGGGTSSALSVSIQNPVPAVQSMQPPFAPAGGGPVTVTISGSGFVNGSTVEWNGAALSTTFVNSTSLQISLSASELSSVGAFPVRVTNPAPGGGVSSPVTFDVQNGVPVVTALSQTTSAAGGAGFVLTVDGSNFVSGSALQWNGAALQTTFVNGNRLSAMVTANLIAQAGGALITVSNPSPSGGVSNALPFSIDPVTNTFVYVAQPAEGLIAHLVVDPVTKQLRPDGFDAVTQPGDGLWALQMDRSRRFLYSLDFAKNQVLGFTVNQFTGSLTAIAGANVATGTEPVQMVSHPSGNFFYVANLSSGDVSGYSVDQNTGSLQPLPGSPFAAGSFPLGIVTDDAGKFVFVTNYGSSTISVYSVAANGALAPVPGSPFAADGVGPTQLAIAPSGKYLFVPNYDSADVSVYAIDPGTGALSAVAGSPYKIGAFPSFLNIDPKGKFLFVSDPNDNIQGLIHVLAVDDATGQLTPAGPPVPVGVSPNRIAFANCGTRAFLTNYASWEMMVFDVNPQDGSMTIRERLPLRNDPDSIAILEGGTPYSTVPQFAYAAQPNLIALFAVDPATGVLSPSQSVPVAAPDTIAMDYDYHFLYAVTTQAGVAAPFRIDAANGTLTPAAIGPFSIGADAKALVFEPTKRFAYVLNGAAGEISQFTVDPATGALARQITVSVGANPSAMAIDPTGRYLYVAFQSSNQVKLYVIGTDGSISLRYAMSTGSHGPSKLAASPDGRFIAALFPTSGEIRIYSIYAPMGDLNLVATAYPGLAPSALAFDPAGQFVLVTDSAASTLSAFRLDSTGQPQLTATVPTGTAPAFLAVDPSNNFVYVANPGSADIHIYRLDTQSGALQMVNTLVLGSGTGVISIR